MNIKNIHEINQAEAYRRAPSIFTQHASPRVSESYQHFSTLEVLKHLSSNGFAPFNVSQSRARGEGKEERQAFLKHQISLVPRTDLGGIALRKEFPQILLTNSHEGTAAFKFRLGVFRLVCTNGLIVSSGTAQEFSVRHSGHVFDEVLQAAEGVMLHASQVMPRIEAWRNTQLSPASQMELAKRALEIRYGGEQPMIDEQSILRAHRYDDNRNDLWTVFNRVQENIVRGGFKVDRMSPGGRIDPRRAKELRSIDELTRVNQELWQAAEDLVLAS